MSSRPADDLSPWPSINDTPGSFPPTPDEPETPTASNPQSLSQAVKARKAEYVRKRTVKVKIGTWNVASISGTEKDLRGWFVEGKGIRGLSKNLSGLNRAEADDVGTGATSNGNTQLSAIETVEEQELRFAKKQSSIPKNDVSALPGGNEIGIYVLGLQEVVDISSPTEALRPYTDPSTAQKWKKAMEEALPPGYQKVADEQLLGLLILVYASPEVSPLISCVSTASVGTGLLGYMGNKGAVSVRMVLGETTQLVFVDCHLAAGSDKTSLERRNWDAAQVVGRTKFEPIKDSAGILESPNQGIGDEDFGFWFGDLNYRLDDVPGDDVRRLLLLHTQNEYDLNNKSKRKIDSELGYVPAGVSDEGEEEEDDWHSDEEPLDPKSNPASLHTTLQSLLPHDQLRKQQQQGRAFHEGWREGEIEFLPTYKYDVGSVGMFDSGEKKRGPSWCDRILFRTRQDRLQAFERIKQEQEARKRDEEMKARGIEEASQENDILFDYDPETDALADGDEYDEAQETSAEPESVTTQDGIEDPITIDHYSSHQRVLSSDHKPLDAVFTLTYDAVVPELRAKVHQEVAKQLDKAENEGRPTVTIVVDHQREEEPSIEPVDESDSPNTQCVEFGDVRYRGLKARSMTLANTGSVTATWSFIDRPVADDETGAKAPPWLSILIDKSTDTIDVGNSALEEYSLHPGETANVDLIVDIDSLDLVRKLNDGIMKLDDILVLRVNNGRDHFIPVRGRWMPTCLCRSIDDLIAVPEGGIRRQSISAGVNNDQASGNGDRNSNNKRGSESSTRVSAPRELFALTEAIQEYVSRSVAEWDMTHESWEPTPWCFQNSTFRGWPFSESTKTAMPSRYRSYLISGIFAALDESEPLKNHFPEDASSLVRLEALSEALLIFLASLKDGIITADMWAEIEARRRENEKSKIKMSQDDNQTLILEILSSRPAHNVSFTFWQFMITRIIAELPQSFQPAATETIFRPPSPPPPPMEQPSQISDPTSPTSIKSSNSIFSSLSLRGRRTRTNTLSSTASSTAGSTVQDTPVNFSSPEFHLSESDRKAAMVRAYATIFADPIIRSGNLTPIKEKEKKALLDRKRQVLEVFLQ